MTEKELKTRTKQFALRIMKLVSSLPKTPEGRAIGGQLVRAGTSVGANYRAACRSRSRAEFAARIAVMEEEADESGYWMELLIEGGLMAANLVAPLLKESGELTAIASASRRSAKSKKSEVDS
jgi:four helix bundle protein